MALWATTMHENVIFVLKRYEIKLFIPSPINKRVTFGGRYLKV